MPKHIKIDYHLVCEKVELGALVTHFITSSDQVEDIFTKSLPMQVFHNLRNKLGLVLSPLTSLRGSDEDQDHWVHESNTSEGIGSFKQSNSSAEKKGTNSGC